MCIKPESNSYTCLLHVHQMDGTSCTVTLDLLVGIKLFFLMIICDSGQVSAEFNTDHNTVSSKTMTVCLCTEAPNITFSHLKYVLKRVHSV